MTGGLENIRPFQKPVHGREVQRPIGQKQQIEPGAQHIGSGSGGVGPGVERRTVVPRVQVPVSRQHEQEPVTKSVQAPKVLPKSWRRKLSASWLEGYGKIRERISDAAAKLDDPDDVQYNAMGSGQLDEREVPFRSRETVGKALDAMSDLQWAGSTVNCHMFGTILAGGKVNATPREAYTAKNTKSEVKTGTYENVDTVDIEALPTMQPLVLRTKGGEIKHTVVRLPNAGSSEKFISKKGHHGEVVITDLKTIAATYGTVEIAPVISYSTSRVDTGEVIYQYSAPSDRQLTETNIMSAHGSDRTGNEHAEEDSLARLRGSGVWVQTYDESVKVKPDGGDAVVAAWTNGTGRVSLYVNPYGANRDTHRYFVEKGLANVANSAITHLDKTASKPITELVIDWGVPVSDDAVDQNPDYTQYIAARDRYLAEGRHPKVARHLAAQATWQYTEVGAPHGFTKIVNIREVGDPDRPTSVMGTMRRESRAVGPDDTAKTEMPDGATPDAGTIQESNSPTPINSIRRARNQEDMIQAA